MLLKEVSTEQNSKVGVYILRILTKNFGKRNITSHLHYGLNCFEYLSGFKEEQISKDLVKIFRTNSVSSLQEKAT